jgi:hypothetical protein
LRWFIGVRPIELIHLGAMAARLNGHQTGSVFGGM